MQRFHHCSALGGIKPIKLIFFQPSMMLPAYWPPLGQPRPHQSSCKYTSRGRVTLSSVSAYVLHVRLFQPPPARAQSACMSYKPKETTHRGQQNPWKGQQLVLLPSAFSLASNNCNTDCYPAGQRMATPHLCDTSHAPLRMLLTGVGLMLCHAPCRIPQHIQRGRLVTLARCRHLGCLSQGQQKRGRQTSTRSQT